MSAESPTAKPPKPKKAKGRDRRSAARLAAVQALYQIELNDTHARLVVDEYRQHRLGHEIDGDQYNAADATFFEAVVLNASQRGAEIDALLADRMPDHRPLDRIEPLVRAVLRAAVAELLDDTGAPAKVVVNEYLDVANAFFEGQEPKFVNGVLDAVGRAVRPSEMSARPAPR